MGSRAFDERASEGPAPRVSGTGSGFALFRVDDRLLHGQVALAWGRALHPECYLLADDRLSEDPEAAELYACAAPEGSHVLIQTTRSLLQGPGAPHKPARTILLVRGLAEAGLLLRGGIPGPLNLGGLHGRPGARAFFPFLFLTDEDQELLRGLLKEGFAVYAQDLPQNPRHDAGQWLPGLVQ